MEHFHPVVNNKGFTLIEVLISATLITILISLFSFLLPNVLKIGEQNLQIESFNQQHSIFIKQFTEEFYTASITTNQELIDFKDLIFNTSDNRYEYEFRPAENKLRKKHGNGYFQSYLDNIQQFDFQEYVFVTSIPSFLCMQMTIEPLLSEKEIETILCRFTY